jgi:SEC-C motif
MYRFREIASRDIEQLPIRPQDRRLTVVAVGYEYSADDARPWYFRVSNFEGKGPISKPQLHPKDSFDLLWARAQRPPVSPTVSASAAGWTLGIPTDSVQELARFARHSRPPSTWVDKAVALIRAAAKSPSSQDHIGTQCSSVVIPADIAKPAQGGYHSAEVAMREYAPGFIEARGGDAGAFIVMDARFGVQDASGTDLVVQVPQVGRNKPCPCGSGRKFKHCHGLQGEHERKVRFGG